MPIKNRIAAFAPDLVAWRRDLHAHPELAFAEHRTADFVAAKLAEFGIETATGIAGTGVVGTIHGDRPGDRAIGLRADMDALPMPEANTFEHASQHPGRMHACGHDGHTAMLLGAARYLAETRNFAGTVHLFFQPAEEGHAGARAMIEAGLFERFPVAEVYGLHNMPSVPHGVLGGRVGPIMAATDHIDIRVHGRGGHAAYPHRAIDPIVAGAQIVAALQTIVSRNVDPLDQAVVSITQFHAGTADNVIADEARLSGTLRSFDPAVRDAARARIRAVAEHVAAGFGARAETIVTPGYPPTVNTAEQLAKAMAAARRVVGDQATHPDIAPSMGGEDFAYMLEAKPGAYLFIGAGAGPGGKTRPLHTSDYDFDDTLLPIGASYWAELAESVLAA